MISLRMSNDARTCKRIHARCFPGEEFDAGTQYWIARAGRRIIGYCSVRVLREGAVFLNRACVFSAYSGNGIQRRMIRARLAWCRRNGYREAITYATHSNVKSWINLLRTGGHIYTPDYAWAGRDVFYFYWKP